MLSEKVEVSFRPVVESTEQEGHTLTEVLHQLNMNIDSLSKSLTSNDGKVLTDLQRSAEKDVEIILKQVRSKTSQVTGDVQLHNVQLVRRDRWDPLTSTKLVRQ